MKFSKGVVKNINKKLISGALAVTLITTGLTGCASPVDSIEYETCEICKNPKINGTINKDVLEHAAVVEMVYKGDDLDIFKTTILLSDHGFLAEYKTDIFTREICDDKKWNITVLGTVKDYLKILGIEKEEYTELDLCKIIEFVEEIQEYKNYINDTTSQKQLVKEK